MANFVLSAFSDEYCDDILGQAKALQRHGIGYTELRHANGKNVADMTDRDVTEIKRVLEDFDIKVSSIGSPLGKIKLDGDMEAHSERAKRVFHTACMLDCKFVRAFSFYLPEGRTAQACKEEAIERVGRLVDLADTFSLTLAHENEAGIYGESPKNCLELFDAFGGRLKGVFDMGNFVLDGFDPVEALKLLKKHIAYFHIKDALYAGAIVPPGKGQAEISRILSDFSMFSTADTFVTVEPHLQTFDGLNALVGKTFDNPYKFESQADAFDEAVKCFKEILNDVKAEK